MSFWSSQRLKSRLPLLINPFEESHIQSALYELSLGEEVYISPLPGMPQDERKKIILDGAKTVPIPPGQFAFLMTLEEVSVPSDAIAFISMKFGVKAKGLINVSGFHVDPGYKGRLIFAVYNAGPLNFHIQYGQQLFSIWFANLDEPDRNTRKGKGFYSIPTDILNVPDAVSSLPYLVTKLEDVERSLAKRLEDAEKKVSAYSAQQAVLYGIIVGIVSSLIVGIALAFPGWQASWKQNTTKPVESPQTPQVISPGPAQGQIKPTQK